MRMTIDAPVKNRDLGGKTSVTITISTESEKDALTIAHHDDDLMPEWILDLTSTDTV